MTGTQHHCHRPGCDHRLFLHHQNSEGNGRCLVSGCDCVRFIELADYLLATVPQGDPMSDRFIPSNEIGELPEHPEAQKVHEQLWNHRHPGVAHFEPLFDWEHLPPDLGLVSQGFSELATSMLVLLEDGPELTAGLRKLVEAKDCAVRQAVIDRKKASDG